MSENEKNGAEEITYTIEDIIQGLLDKQENDDLDTRGLAKSNISGFLKKFFDSINLPDAKKILKSGKDFAFTEQEKPLIERLIMERNGKLKRHKGGDYKGQIVLPDFEFLFEIVRDITAMLVRRGYDEDNLYEAMEMYMTQFLKNEASISITISQRLQAVLEGTITKNIHLRTFDKFVWMRAMEEELNRVIDKWTDIFWEYDELLGEAISEQIETMYFEPQEVEVNGETVIKTEEELFGDCVRKYMDEWGKAQLKLLEEEKENLLSERKKIEKKHNDKINFYRTKIDKRSKDKSLCLEEIKRMQENTMEIDDKLERIDKKRERIYGKCQELAYDELHEEDEKNPITLPDTRTFLRKAKEIVESGGKDKKWEEMFNLISDAKRNGGIKNSL